MSRRVMCGWGRVPPDRAGIWKGVGSRGEGWGGGEEEEGRSCDGREGGEVDEERWVSRAPSLGAVRVPLLAWWLRFVFQGRTADGRMGGCGWAEQAKVYLIRRFVQHTGTAE
ncbi:hypothetical protein PLESTB_000635400 [Pleodorina starrii]|uniref:Uncharacterized protein n=1 Tax=Pleodorina starrii TaxID=330485 RepID=A0A9W6BIL6_9CHLO|nr:hypothetical protein PLESTB_000635400 [Pleodorina starrii]